MDVTTGKISAVGHERFMLLGIDGLYRHGNTLIGIQNYIFPEAVIRYRLSSHTGVIDHMEFMASNDTRFDTRPPEWLLATNFISSATASLCKLYGTGDRSEIRRN